MKRNVKGFTLIELIVVMATFSIIMFGAMSLMTPVSKMMVQSDTHEGGNAAVSSIATLLQDQLSPAEYIAMYNEPLTDPDARKSAVNEFVKEYYEGVLRSGSTVSDLKYGSGTVHVMTINNEKEKNGQISTYAYDVSFDPKSTSYIKPGSNDHEVPYAVNKAYYDDYILNIKSGLFENPEDLYDRDPTSGDIIYLDPPANTTPKLKDEAYAELSKNLNSKNTVFTISATTVRNNTEYNFMSNVSMSLVNIYNRGGGGVAGKYYVLNEKLVPDSTSPDGVKWDNQIVDITTPNISTYGDSASQGSVTKPYSEYSREKKGVTVGSYVSYNATPAANGYTFIYSYGNEIDIS